jgi:hypothetical protein
MLKPRLWLGVAASPVSKQRVIVMLTYQVYRPPEGGLPWLAVVLDGNKPIDMIGCADRTTAERCLREMRLRLTIKRVPDREQRLS